MLSGKPSGQEQAIYITGKTPFLRKRTCTRRSVWSNHEKADRPISSQHRRCYQEANLELFHEQMQKCRSIPCAADSRQHARIADIPNRLVLNRLPLTVLGIGDIAILGLGGEPFTDYIYAARDAAPQKFMLTACCANGGEGYFPTAAAYEQGGYEVDTSPFNPDVEALIMDAAAEMLKGF